MIDTLHGVEPGIAARAAVQAVADPNWAERSASARAAAWQALAAHGAFISVADDVEPPSGSPLSGLPFAAADTIDVQGFATTAGSALLAESAPLTDAPVVAALRAAGAYPLGKTNLRELATGVTGNGVPFGPVRNPIDATRSAGGPSGGSAVAVALDVVPFSLGTDTDGSVRISAAHCGVVGFRPSTGRYSARGVVPVSSTRDTVGIVGNAVELVRLVDSVLAPHDADDQSGPDLQLRGLRIGVPRRGFCEGAFEVAAHVEGALAALHDAGADLVDIDFSRAQHLAGECANAIVMYEFFREVPRYLASLQPPYSNLTIRQLAGDLVVPGMTSVLDMIARDPVSTGAYSAALARREELQRLYESVFAANRLDAIAYPTVPMLAPPLGDEELTDVDGELLPVWSTSTRNTAPGSIAGTPAVSLPCGRVRRGLPVGMSFEGLRGSDRHLLQIVRAASRALASG